MTATEILRRLVAIATPSAVSNAPLLDYVREFLEPQQWRVTLQPYADENGISKANLVARPAIAEAEAPIELAFVCHTDTVPYAAAWTGALELRERDGYLHGCGACDVKGALACFLAAIHAHGKGAMDAGTALILTADEEIGCKGMENLLAAGFPHIGAAIVSEPTSLRAGVAGKGYGLARVTVEGVEAHSAYPAEGVSAIEIAARFIERLHATARMGQETDTLFDPPRTTLNVGVIEGGSAKNIIAGKCSFLVEWRPIPADPPERMLREIVREAVDMQALHDRSRVTVEPLRAEAGFAPAPYAGRLLRKLAEVSGAQKTEVTGISFGSEASRVARIADEVIVMGPGDMHTAHSDRECVPARELEEWTAILGRMLRQN